MRKLARCSVVGSAVVLVAALGPAVPALASGGSDGREHHGRAGVLLKADLIGSLTKDAKLFGVAPGGADWTVSNSRVKVRTDGRVDAKVRRLVLTKTGENPVPMISASLVCNGKVVDSVGPVAYNMKGNARIKDTFMVPRRCLAPAVLLHPNEVSGVYIAASGAVR
jgi:hypothetical protein